MTHSATLLPVYFGTIPSNHGNLDFKCAAGNENWITFAINGSGGGQIKSTSKQEVNINWKT